MIIDELKKQVRSIEERFITNDQKSLMTDPSQLTAQPTSPDAEAERSPSLDGTVYREPDSPSITPKDEFGIDNGVDDLAADEPSDVTPEQKEVTEREELDLCLDVAFEAIQRAKEIVEGNEDTDVFDEPMMKRIEELSEKAVEFADMVENKVYDYEDSSDEEDSDVESEEPEEGSEEAEEPAEEPKE